MLAAATTLTPVGPAAAQALTPGAVQDTLGQSRPALPATPAQVILPVQPAPSAHDPRGRRFRVNAFAMQGNTVFRERLLKTVVERFVDMELNLHDLNRAADAITAFYHERGYTLARAFIPAQRVEHGVVQIHVVEGRFGQTGFTGNRRYGSDFLGARLHHLGSGNLVTTERLETDMLLLNDLPGLSAKAVLSPGTEFGSTDAEIKVEEKLFNASVNVNNHGRAETGQKRIDASVSLNAPFGWGDQLTVAATTTDHRLLRYGKIGYSLPLTTAGTRLSLGISRAEFQVAGALAALGIRGEVENAELTMSHPFVRTRGETHVVTIGLKQTHLVQNALGATLADNRLRVMTATYQVNHVHPDSAITNASFALSTNFRSGNTFTSQSAVFARMEADVSHVSPFYKQWDIYLRGNAVFNREMLPDTEKFSLGGPSSVRAYRPSELRGDSGMQFTAELRRPFSIGGALGSFRLALDAGQAVYKAPGFRDSHQNLGSAGFGVSLFPVRGVVTSIDVARPVRSATAPDGKKLRVWMSASASF